MDIFDHLKNLTLNKKDFDSSDDETKSSYKNDRYMINRYISMVEQFIPYVNMINQFDVPYETHYRYYLNVLPQRNCYFRYIKKDNELTNETIGYIARFYDCSIKEAKMYINMLSSEEITTIINKYTYGNNKKMKL